MYLPLPYERQQWIQDMVLSRCFRKLEILMWVCIVIVGKQGGKYPEIDLMQAM